MRYFIQWMTTWKIGLLYNLKSSKRLGDIFPNKPFAEYSHISLL